MLLNNSLACEIDESDSTAWDLGLARYVSRNGGEISSWHARSIRISQLVTDISDLKKTAGMYFREFDETGDSSTSLLDSERETLASKEDIYPQKGRFQFLGRFHEYSTLSRYCTDIACFLTSLVYSCYNNAAALPIALLPSFLTRTADPPSPNAIAALDGLRGFASLGVFTLHFTDTFCDAHNWGWGFDDKSHYWFQLPFVHYFFASGSLVGTFFVISGYVLSHKPLQLMYAAAKKEPVTGDADAKFLVTMRSAIFRRGIRLYVPCILATFISFCMLRAGIYDYPHQVFGDGWTKSGEDTPFKFPTFWEQFWDWANSMWEMTYLFKWGGSAPGYDPHLFTIPTEFQGSMILFFVIMGISKCRTGVRMASIAALILYCGWFGQNEILLFFLGMLTCDVDLWLRQTSAEGRDKIKRMRWIWVTLFVPGLYLAGTPQWDTKVTPGYRTMMWMMDNWFRWQTIGCGLLVWSVRNSRDLQVLFTNGFAQYLGNISFALYIVHGNVRRTVSYAVIPTLMEWTNGKESRLGYVVMVIVNTICTYTTAIWLADLWWRFIDIPSIRLARWLEARACIKKD